MKQKGPEGKSDPSVRLNPEIASREWFPFHSAQGGLPWTRNEVSRHRIEVGDGAEMGVYPGRPVGTLVSRPLWCEGILARGVHGEV